MMPTPWQESPRIGIDTALETAARYAAVPPRLVSTSRELLEATLADIASLVPVELAELVDARTEGRFRDEAEALASLVGTTWQRVMLANISYDVTLSGFACSTAAIATAEGPVLFRNLDWWPEQLLAQGSCVLEYRRSGEAWFTSAGWAGASGAVTGWSARGFAAAINAVSGLEGTDLEGYPVLLFLRTVLEDATSFDDAVHRLSQERLASPALFVVVGREPTERIVIERTPSRFAHRTATGDEPLITTNDYRALTSEASAAGDLLHRTACDRYDALNALAHELGPSPTNDELLSILADDAVRMQITAQHVVARPALAELRLFAPTRLLNA